MAVDMAEEEVERVRCHRSLMDLLRHPMTPVPMAMELLVEVKERGILTNPRVAMVTGVHPAVVGVMVSLLAEVRVLRDTEATLEQVSFLQCFLLYSE